MAYFRCARDELRNRSILRQGSPRADQQTKVPPNIDRCRLQGKSALETVARFRQLTLFSLRVSKVVVCLCRIWPERNGALMAGGGFFEPAQIPKCISQVVEGFGRVRSQSQQLLEAGRRILQLAKLAQEHTQIVLSLGVIRPQDHRALIVRLCGFELPLLSQDKPKVVVRLG